MQGRRGRKADPPRDDTPFEARTVDVEARAGLLLRHNRAYGPNTELATGSAMVAALGKLGVPASPADISHWERGATPAPARVIEAYESLTGAAPGSLRGIIETTRRCYSATRIVERRRDRQVFDLEVVTDRCQVIFEGTPRGIDWLHFSDLLADDHVVLPSFLVAAPCARLVSEMSRAVGVAYLTRYEALASMLDGPYATQAREAISRAVFDEHAQVVIDAIGALSESPNPAVLTWLTTMLRHWRPDVVRGAAYAIDNALETGRVDDDTLDVVSSAVIAAYLDTEEEPRRAMASVIRALPPDHVAPLLAKLDDTARAQIRQVEGLRAPDERAPLLAIAQRMQLAVTHGIGPDQPLLTRLIYEALFEERATRRFHATFILKAVPYQARIAAANANLARAHPDPEVRRAATESLMRFGHLTADGLGKLIASPDLGTQRAGLVASAHCQVPLATADLRPFLTADHPLWSKALYAAGMNGDPIIDHLADDPSTDPSLRGAARWWRREGPAITD